MFLRYNVTHFKIGDEQFVRIYDHKTKSTIIRPLKKFWDEMADEFSRNGGFIYGEKFHG